MRAVLVLILTGLLSAPAAHAQSRDTLDLGPVDIGVCEDACQEAFFFGKTSQGQQTVLAELTNGDFKGIWGTGGVAVLMFETFDGAAAHITLQPNGQATVKFWEWRGTSLNPGDPDFVGIWGNGGTYISPGEMLSFFTSDNVNVVPEGSSVVSLQKTDKTSGTDQYSISIMVDTTDALVARNPAN